MLKARRTFFCGGYNHHSLIFLLFFLIFFTKVYAFDFNLQPTMVSFRGVVSSGNNIIVYGTYGTYLFSTDFGETWEQRSVGSYDVINKIVNYNDTLWGIMQNGQLLISVDNGNSWKIFKYELESGEDFIGILVNDKSIYLRGINSIMMLNRSLEVEKVLKDLRLKEYLTLDSVGPKTQKFYRETSFPLMFFIDNKLILTSDSASKFGFIVIDENLNEVEPIYLKGKVKSHPNFLHDYFSLANIIDYQDKKLFLINNSLYYTDSSFSNWKTIFADTNFSFPLDYRVCSPSSMFCWNDTLYMLFTPEISISRRGTGLGIKKYLNTPKDTLIVVGEPYFSDYWKTPYPALLASAQPTLLFDSLLIIIYDPKTFLITKHLGKTWKYISCLYGSPSIILSDSTFFFVTSNDTRIFKTTNGGITFLPPMFYDDGVYINPLSFESKALFYVDETGRGFIKGYQSFYPQYFYVTDDYWDSFVRHHDLFEFSLPTEFTTNIIKQGDTYLFAASDTSFSWLNYNIAYFTFFCYIDTGLQKSRVTIRDTLSAVFHILPISENLGEFIGISLVNDGKLFTKVHFEIRQYSDSGRTFTTLHRIDEPLKVNQIYEHNWDSIFIAFREPDRLYLYDCKREVLELLWENNSEDSQNPMIMYLGGKFYLVGRGLFLENTNRNDLTQWREGRWDYGKPNFESVIFKGNVALAGLSDSVRPFNYYKLTPKQVTKVEELEVRYTTLHFWASPAYPLPAKNIVRSRVYWDESFELLESIEGVYNSLGMKVEGRERVLITPMGRGKAELIWHCTGIPAGVYFIVVRHHGKAETIPVIVE